jgi:hypothetical protein
MKSEERSVRKYADHLGLVVRGKGPFTLIERYDNAPSSKSRKGRVIGTYRSVNTLERGIERYGEMLLRESKRKRAAKKRSPARRGCREVHGDDR